MQKIVFIPILLILTITCYSQPGSLDLTFNPNDEGFGYEDYANGEVFCSAIQTDGKIIIGGYFTKYNGRIKNRLARINPDGSLDLTFDSGIGPNSPVLSVSMQDDGKIIISGNFRTYNGKERDGIARLNSDGSLDDSFYSGLWGHNTINSFKIQSDGKIIVAGALNKYTNNVIKCCVARLNSDGNIDETFNISTLGNPDQEFVKTIALQNDDKIIVAGEFENINGISRHNIARINPDGSLDVNFNPSINNSGVVRSISLQNDRKIIVAGGNSYPEDGFILRLNVDGSIDPTFSFSGLEESPILTTIIQNDGKVLIGGEFWKYNNLYVYHLIRLNSNGNLDTTFNNITQGSGILGYVSTILLQNDGKIIVGGDFSSVNGISRKNIARINTDGSLDETFKNGTSANNNINSTCIQNDGKILIGGFFTTYNGKSQNNLARLIDNGDNETSFKTGVGPNGPIYSISIQNNGQILIGGGFTKYNNINRNCIARLNSDGNLDATFDPGTGANERVNTIIVQNDEKIIIAGNFTQFNGKERKGIARLNKNGSIDVSFYPGSGITYNSEIYSTAIQSDGKIIIGGDFSSFNGKTCNRIVRLNSDGSLDESFKTTEALDVVYTVSLQKDGKIIIGGAFAWSDLKRLNSDGSNDIDFNSKANIEGSVSTSYIENDGKIIIGGSFNKVNKMIRNHIARLNSDGNIDLTFDPGTGTNSGTTSISSQKDGKILIAGSFTSFNGIGKNRIARIYGGDIKPSISTLSLGNDKLCSGSSFPISYTVVGSFNSGNIFTAQLSDINGSFASPTIIGTLASITSGNINVLIPEQSYGKGYRFRVISSDPNTEGSDNGTDITINKSTTSAITIIACDNFTLNSQTYSTSGVYTQKLTNNGGCDSTITLNLIINESIYAGKDSLAIVCSNVTPKVDLYNYLGNYYELGGTWFDISNTNSLNGSIFNTEAIAQGKNYQFEYVVNGSASCPNDTAYVSLFVDICENLKDFNTSKIVVFPNPATGSVFIDFQNCQLIPHEINILDNSGKKIVQEKVSISKGLYDFDLTKLNKGIFYIKILFDEGVKYFKIIAF